MESLSTTGLFWGIPVRADLLGARLQAHYEQSSVLSILNQERAKDGTKAPISQLPPEILSMISLEVLRSAEIPLEKEWRKDFQCALEACDTWSHVSPEWLQETWFEACIDQDLSDIMAFRPRDEKLDYMGGSCYCGAVAPKDCDVVQDCLLGDDDSWRNTHYNNIRSWTTRVDQTITQDGEKGKFVKYEEVCGS